MKRPNCALAIAITLILGACSGNLYVDERSLGQACTDSADCGVGAVCNAEVARCIESPGPCSTEQPDGDCATGRHCVAGVCACVSTDGCDCTGDCLAVPDPWCDCVHEHGCIDGSCVAITDDNRCAPNRLDGACPGAEACIGGYCAPNQHRCGPLTTDAWCDAGLSCVAGRCVPTSDRPCEDAPGLGLCPAGTTCAATGACELTACGPGQPGACAEDEVCTAAGCEALPCSAVHLGGDCPTNQICSRAGLCIADDTCRVDDDCEAGPTYCSVGERCLVFGSCAGDEDCTSHQASGIGQGYGCRVGSCVENTTCVLPTDCVPDKLCSTDGNCLEGGQCDGDDDCLPADFCATTGACAERGTCLTHGDCNTSAGERCGRGSEVCIGPGQCHEDLDCPPAHLCNGVPGACVPDTAGATACDSNTLLRGTCAPGELSCCSGNCCPAGDRCSEGIGLCISQGECASHADCAPGFRCSADFACQPIADCSGGCDAGTERCSSDQTCLDWDLCTRDRDCPTGERCGADWKCVAFPECGSEALAAEALVPPHILFVLDRSGSMNVCGDGEAVIGQWCGHDSDHPFCCEASSPANVCEDCTALTSTMCDDDSECDSSSGAADGVCASSGFCATACDDNADCGPGGTCSCSLFAAEVCNAAGLGVCAETACVSRGPTDIFGDDPTRWADAVSVINQVASGNTTRIEFGLSTYPRQCDNAGPCWLTCNWLTCTADCDGDGRGNVFPGEIDVAVGPGTEGAIASALSGTWPGGGTPTAATLRTILANPAAAGLAAEDRSNVVILVTDGEANGDASSISTCAPPCSDGEKNGNETDVDCGGACALIADSDGSPRTCADGLACRVDQDCTRGLCLSDRCLPPACGNGVLDPLESDLDCGGPCLGCESGALCDDGNDCASGACSAGRCDNATCDDTRQNGTETGVDCGGGCVGCPDAQACENDDDCESETCRQQVCRPGHCGNASLDGDEIAADCGGSCAPCPPAATCVDGVLNGSETDIDCGGATCAPCPGGMTCAAGSDCLSDACEPCGAAGDVRFPSPSQNCRVNAALDGLYARDPSIRTFVVGLAFDSVNDALNCHAAHGRTARCAGITTDNCAQQANACYYEANDASSLTQRLGTIIDKVSTCTFGLLEEPEDPERLYVYFDWDDDGSPPLDPQRMVREYHWRYDRARRQIELLGQACADVQAGDAQPVVVRGCPPAGG